MSDSIYIRPLQIEDAEISYQWRNNPKIWKWTGSKPASLVTLEIETKWLGEVLLRDDEKRFAICLKQNDKYIGNVFLTEIKSAQAQVHIFIGELLEWGKDRAFDALCLIVDYGFKELNLECIYGVINKKNIFSIALAKRIGAVLEEEFYDEARCTTMVKWVFTKQMQMKNISLTASDNFIETP